MQLTYLELMNISTFKTRQTPGRRNVNEGRINLVVVLSLSWHGDELVYPPPFWRMIAGAIPSSRIFPVGPWPHSRQQSGHPDLGWSMGLVQTLFLV